jgi:hypothetical protein
MGWNFSGGTCATGDIPPHCYTSASSYHARCSRSQLGHADKVLRAIFDLTPSRALVDGGLLQVYRSMSKVPGEAHFLQEALCHQQPGSRILSPEAYDCSRRFSAGFARISLFPGLRLFEIIPQQHLELMGTEDAMDTAWRLFQRLPSPRDDKAQLARL